jgi:DNA-directed RNA polymerase specialized sigma24 family protein
MRTQTRSQPRSALARCGTSTAAAGGEAVFEAWIFRIASNPVVDKLRTAIRERVGDDLDLDPGSAIDQAGVFTAPQEAIGGHVARARDLLSPPGGG